jgi:hypothetical protein
MFFVIDLFFRWPTIWSTLISTSTFLVFTDYRERQAAYKACFEKIRKREQELADRGEELEQTMEALRRDGAIVIEGGFELDEPERGDEKKLNDWPSYTVV